jgi:hypothetical protein
MACVTLTCVSAILIIKTNMHPLFFLLFPTLREWGSMHFVALGREGGHDEAASGHRSPAANFVSPFVPKLMLV